MEVADVFAGKSVQFFDLKDAGHCLLKCYFVTVVKLHQEHVQEVDHHQAVNRIVFDYVTNQEVAHNGQVYQEQNRVSDRNPPINASVFVCQSVEEALNNQSIKGTLLHCSLNSYIRNSHENAVDHDEAFGCGV